MSCITETTAIRFVSFLKTKGAYFIPKFHFEIGPVISLRNIEVYANTLYKNIHKALLKQPLVFCELSTSSQKFGWKHAIALACKRNEDNTITIEYFDSNGIMEPFKLKSDMFWVSMFTRVRQLFGENENVSVDFIEMNIRNINKNQCNSWAMFYYYTRLAYSHMSSREFFSFVYTWEHSMIENINKFISKKMSQVNFNTFITNQMSNVKNTNKFNKIKSIANNYTKYNYKKFNNISKIPQGIKKKLESL